MQGALYRTRSHIGCRWPLRPCPCRPRRAGDRRPPLKAKGAALRKPMTAVSAKQEESLEGLKELLDSVKWSEKEPFLVPVIVQHVDTGELLMQAYADRAAMSETMQTKLATFYSRSRKGRWCKGETSGNYIHVIGVYLDCDRDSVVYLGDPIGPSCHTGARTCWFKEFTLENGDGQVTELTAQETSQHTPQTTLLRLESTIDKRKQEAAERPDEGSPSWTAKLLKDPELLCRKIMEEAQELCDTMTKEEGKVRTAEEMADVLYHAMVLLNLQDVCIEDVLKVLRGRFGTSGIEEKASRPKKRTEKHS